jgi:hypothetical protein
MWDQYCQFVRTPYKDGRSAKLEEFRLPTEPPR